MKYFTRQNEVKTNVNKDSEAQYYSTIVPDIIT